jgi:hemin uptake protein HemP
MHQMSELTRPSTLTLRASALSTASRHRTNEASCATQPERVPPAKAQDAVSGTNERTLRSDVLLQGHRQVLITHNGETYQLRATRLGKLILTK